ncbi:MAG: AMP-binding protein [Thermomicrobiales bacterium]
MPEAERGDVDVQSIAWCPDVDDIERSGLQRLLRRTGAGDYPTLLREIAADPKWYWKAAMDDLDLEWSVPFRDVWDLSSGKMWPKWFPEAGFNYVHNALDRHADGARSGHTALVWEDDAGACVSLTYRELGGLTDRAANAFRALGVGKGDRVGIFLPMCPETVAAMLACGKLGAIVVPLFSGYGVAAIVTRLQGCSAKLLVTTDCFSRRGNPVSTKVIADEAMESLPSIEHCVVVRRSDAPCSMVEPRDQWWHDVVPTASTERVTEQTLADDPCMILYTSGTTGMPKGAVHIHAGFPIKAMHDLTYCFDLTEDDTLFWFTDLGWMMGPWLITGGLMAGATIVLFEGTPDYPEVDRLWDLVERHKVTILGLAPTAIRSLMAHGTGPVLQHDLSSLRILGSTGETWNPDPWRWHFDVIGGGRCPIINYSGGTETSGGIISGFTSFPIKACSFSGMVPGMVADVVDDEGTPARNTVGELVIREPWVGMTNGFWNEPERYEETYWSRFPGVWVHGDFAEIDDDGFWFIRGRSDDTINVAGKRIGPSEIESAAVGSGSVREAAAIAVPHPIKGDVVVVFVIPLADIARTEEAEETIRHFIGRQLGGSMRPEQVVFVDDLPRTRNAKIMRRTIRAAWLDLEFGDTSALENPLAVEAIRALSPHRSS